MKNLLDSIARVQPIRDTANVEAELSELGLRAVVSADTENGLDFRLRKSRPRRRSGKPIRYRKM